MLVHAKTDIGKVRETNEDSFVCMPPLFVVADGMGGHVAGEIASSMTADTLRKFVAAQTGTIDPVTLLEQAIGEANSLVFRLAQERSECAGMGTTVTAAYIDGSKIYWGHVGDSRLYLLHGNQLRQITEDHSLVGELERNGSISHEEALIHPQRNVLVRAVGTSEQIRVDTGVAAWTVGDKLLFCSDGLTNMVSDEDILNAINAATPDGEVVLKGLIEMANAAGGFDNITAILVQNEDA